jgi:hypothetical protein
MKELPPFDELSPEQKDAASKLFKLSVFLGVLAS